MEMVINLAAEDVYEIMSKLIKYYKGNVSGVSYDALSVLNLALLKEHEAEIQSLKQEIIKLGGSPKKSQAQINLINI